MLQTATFQSAFVANVLSVRLTHFTHPHHSTPCQIVRSRPGGKRCAGCRTVQISALTRNTNPATQSGVMRLWRDSLHTVCHLGGMNRSLSLTLVRVSEAGEASVRSVGNG